MNIRNADGLLSSEVVVGNVVWVDGKNGIDQLGVRGRMTIPFRTLSAAKAAAVAGDTIVVMPGNYFDQDLAKDGVIWWFYPGAVVSSSSSTFYLNSSGSAGTMKTLRVFGHGRFLNTNAGGTLSAILHLNNADYWDVVFECDSAEATGAGSNSNCVYGSTTNSNSAVSLRGRRFITNAAIPVMLFQSGNWQVRVDRITAQVNAAGTLQDGAGGVSVSGGSVSIYTDMIYGGSDAALTCSGGTTVLTAWELNAATAFTDTVVFSGASTLLSISNARIIGSATGLIDLAGINLTSGSTGATPSLRLYNCTVIGNSPTASSIEASAATSKVASYGSLVLKQPTSTVTMVAWGVSTQNVNVG